MQTPNRKRGRVPDFEIRYFNADGTLAVIHVTCLPSADAAHEHAERQRHPHHRFEVREITGAPPQL
jgi:hypothetical protein